tara:strand:+ start:1935 stop:3155 length:1221 start_codon:yes stop_codon:yes gene_type:complete
MFKSSPQAPTFDAQKVQPDSKPKEENSRKRKAFFNVTQKRTVTFHRAGSSKVAVTHRVTAQGFDLVKNGKILQPGESGTPANEFVGPLALTRVISHWPVTKVFGRGTRKRWSAHTIHEYLKLFPETCDSLLRRCYYPDYVHNPQKYIDFCDSLQGLQKIRTPEKDGKWLERDTQWYSFVDREGFSTVYRGGSIDYGLPKAVKPQQFKMDADFQEILPTVSPLLAKINEDFGEQPNHCVITRYNRTYDGIRNHTDKTKDLVRGSSIFVFTFGAEKTFEVVHDRRMANPSHNPEHYQKYRKEKSKKAKTVAKWNPTSGSLIRMTWDMNQVFEHGVPIKAKPTSRLFKEEREMTRKYDTPAPRYSITFRTKCTWYQPYEQKTFVDTKWQLSSLQSDGAVRVVLPIKKHL